MTRAEAASRKPKPRPGHPPLPHAGVISSDKWRGSHGASWRATASQGIPSPDTDGRTVDRAKQAWIGFVQPAIGDCDHRGGGGVGLPRFGRHLRSRPLPSPSSPGLGGICFSYWAGESYRSRLRPRGVRETPSHSGKGSGLIVKPLPMSIGAGQANSPWTWTRCPVRGDG